MPSEVSFILYMCMYVSPYIWMCVWGEVYHLLLKYIYSVPFIVEFLTNDKKNYDLKVVNVNKKNWSSFYLKIMKEGELYSIFDDRVVQV